MLTKLGKFRACASMVMAVVGGIFTASAAADHMNIGKDVNDFKEALQKDDEMYDDDNEESDPEDGDDTILEMMARQNSAQSADPVQA